MTGGGFSARFQTGNDSLVSITKPKLKSGCGGIDAFWGGMSFMNPDYLIKKFQNMIQNAPAVAFQMALKSLSDQLSTTISGFEGITNQLNNLSLDDCAASKAMVATIASPFAGTEKAKELDKVGKDFLQSSGVTDLYDNAGKNLKMMVTNQKPVQKGIMEAQGINSSNPLDNPLLAGCPDEIKNLITSSQDTMLGYYGQKMGLDASFTDLMRGLVGDLETVYDGAELSLVPITACVQTPDYEKFLDGNVKMRDADGNCTVIADSKKGLRSTIKTEVNSLLAKMKAGKTGTALTAADIAFIESSPIPIYGALKVAVMTGQEAALVDQMAEILSRTYAQRILTDLYSLTQLIIEKASAEIDANFFDEGTDSAPCHFPEGKGLAAKAQEISDKLKAMNVTALNEYKNSMDDYTRSIQFIERLETISKAAQRQIAEDLGPAVARRVTRRG